MLILDRLIGLIAPHTCIYCGSEGSLLCRWCMHEIIEPVPSRCYRCKKLTSSNSTCRSCRRVSPLRHVWVATEYAALPKKLIHRFKFDHAPAARHPIAQLMHEELPFLSPDTLVVHVPTATSRRRQRGYDHAELLAREIARLSKLKYLPLLVRTGQTRQVGSKRSDRLKQLQASYRVSTLYDPKGAEILLIDDITTTGATLESAARVLKKSGAKTINAAVFAGKGMTTKI
jgi:competence protein ComFC